MADDTRELAERGDLHDDVPETETIAAVLGSASRKGEWEPAEITRVFTALGNADLDLRRALLAPGVTEVQILAVLGSVTITVPEGLDVEVTGSALLGGFRQDHQPSRSKRFLRRALKAARGDPDEEDEFEPEEEPPLLRVTGLALLGNVQVRVR
jgi:hypothetical protein